jgi:glucokinase
VAGGIAPKLIDALRGGAFLAAFRAKGRMEPLLDRIRVGIVMDPAVGLLGARRKAVDLLLG